MNSTAPTVASPTRCHCFGNDAMIAAAIVDVATVVELGNAAARCERATNSNCGENFLSKNLATRC